MPSRHFARRFGAALFVWLGLALPLLIGVTPPCQAQAEPSALRVLVAVLPFEVHSAETLGELEVNLAELLRARLEASGRVEVLDTVLLRQALVEHVAGETSASLLQQRAVELGADWIVEGSLTELAGLYSLDVRVRPVDSPTPAQTMVYTADGQEELLERANELSNRVLAIVAGDPRSGAVTAVGILGIEEGPDREALLDLLETRVGEPFDGGAVQRDLEILRGDPRVGVASVETEREGDGMAVSYRVVPVERFGGTISEGTGDLVLEIRIEGNRRIEADAIRARIETQIGDPFSAARLAEDVRSVNNLGFFRDLRVFTERSEAGRILIFEIEEHPVVRQITIAGNDALDAEKIREQLTLTTGSTLDLPLLIENRERVEVLYQAEGYHLADVDYEIEELPNDAVAVHFEVEEGKKLKLRAIRFEGNEHFTDRELSADLQVKPWKFYNIVTQFIQKGAGVYAEPLFVQDLQTVEKRYADAGYLRSEIGDPEVDATEQGLTVTVPVTEGDRFRTGKLDVRGDPNLEIDDVRETLALEESEWFNRSGLTDDVDQIEFRYTNQGFYRAEVEPLTKIHESSKTVDVLFEIEKGPLYFVRQIDVLGNTRTVDRVLRREINIVEGELYSARSVAISRRRLQNLGYFDEVNFEAKPTDQNDQVDLDVKVAEKPTGTLSFGAGFSSRDSFVLNASITQNNLFGRGYGVSISGDLGRRRTRMFASLTDRRLFDSDYGLSLSLFNTEIDFDGFEENNIGADVTLSRALDQTTNTRGFLRYGIASREIEIDTSFVGASPVLRQFEQDATQTSRVSLIVSRDTRNEPILPTEGYQGSITGTFAGLGGFTRFLRFEGRGGVYTQVPRWLPLPLRERSSFQLSGGIGWTLPFNTVNDFDLQGPDNCTNEEVCPLEQIDRDIKLPLNDRYFLGGVQGIPLRGFKARSLGPRRAEVIEINPGGFLPNIPRGLYTPNGRDIFGQCLLAQGCNNLDDKDIDDFVDLDNASVVGGTKFVQVSTEYRFPISEEVGLVGILFFDAGNAFAEKESMFNVDEWRMGTGVGALWFSPFGPLEVFWGLPLDPLDDERKSVFEFNVGGSRL